MTPLLPPVLYIEDEENDVVLLKLAFKRAGLSRAVQVLTDGKQAVEYLCGEGAYSDRTSYPLPCLVLLDLNLPQLDGFSVLQRIRTEDQLKDLPVLIFSSSEHSSDKARAQKLGANAYIVKPSRIDGFVRFAQTVQDQWLTSAKKALS